MQLLEQNKSICVSAGREDLESRWRSDMLAAYYGKDNDSAALFDGLEISHSETFSTHLNKYNVF